METQTTARTAGPWHVAEDGSSPKRKMIVVCDCANDHVATIIAESTLPEPQRQANAAFIVTACNAHDDLVAALINLDGLVDRIRSGSCVAVDSTAVRKIAEQARAALAKAGV